MDIGIINIQQGNMRIHASMDNGDAEASEGGEVTLTDISVAQDENGIMEPKVGMKFESEDAAKTFYNVYARRSGFTTRTCETGRFRPDSAVSSSSRQYVCAKQGSKRRPSETCEAMLKITLKSNKWAVTKFVKEHNHPIESLSKENNIRPHRHFSGALKNVTENYRASVVVPSGVMYVSINGNHVSHASSEANCETRSVSPVVSHRQGKRTNCVNYTVRPGVMQRRTLGKDAQNMLDYFRKMQAENPGFFYAIQLDEENRMANAFWADAKSRTAYSHFGDVVTLDTSYRVNQYKVPFAPFTGVNHHGQTILFGCALLLDESEPSFVWLLKTFLTAMGGCPPVSIVTDQDIAIKDAVSEVLPKARHCISKWHILREGQERLAHVCRAYPNFQVELYNCINLTETTEEFESSWASVIDKYDMRRDDWLQSLYNARREWAPVYFRDSFFAIVSPNQGADTSFFDGFVNQQTTLPIFFRQYERAVEYWFEKEIEADFDTISNTPILRTPSPMEKQAAKLYTVKIFAKFQEELVETFVYTANRVDGYGATSRTYRVAKFENDYKAYTVTLNISDMRASCSCQMFEYSGILCRHILTVFTVTNVLTLPSHYILRRWTRNAKSMVKSDEHGVENVPKSVASRYNFLCQEGIRHAEEGAIYPETYTIALTALREGRKTMDVIKSDVAKLAPQTPQAAPTRYDDKKSYSIVDTPLLWPRQDEITRKFNLNDSTSHPDFNVLPMAPVSIQRDDGPSDNMAALPCLKSMTWAMDNKSSTPANRVAVINLKLQNYSKSPTVESEVKFQLTRITLEPMLRSMAYISEQLSAPVNRVAVINLKLQDSETTCGESEVKFQVSRDTLGAMLRSMAYIREQLSLVGDQRSKKQRK